MTEDVPKGYWMVHLTVHDGGAFMTYLRAVRGIFKDWNATYIVQAGAAETREGATYDRHVIVMFESFAAARACYDSPAYKQAIKLRKDCAELSVVIAEGIS